MTIEISRRGYPFGQVRPRGDRNVETRTISVAYVVDEGSRAYIERINVRGNIRTREYVIRREFDISEGDPYNRALIDRAERRLKNLNYFKTVKITNEPGSAPDRVVINVDVVEQSTGDFSVSGGYSTSDGFLATVAISRAQSARHRPICARLGVLWPVHPRRRAQFRRAVFSRSARLIRHRSLCPADPGESPICPMARKTIGTNVKFGIPLREDLSLQLRYSLYRTEITLPNQSAELQQPQPGFREHLPDAGRHRYPERSRNVRYQKPLPPAANRTAIIDGEASLPVRKELQGGAYLTSAVGYGLTYNTLDNNKSPTGGLLFSASARTLPASAAT